MTDAAQALAKELYLEPTEDGRPKYTLQQVLDKVTQELPAYKGRLTLSILRSLTRQLGDADPYTWEELREIAVNLGVTAKDRIPGATWEEVILNKKAEVDRMAFNTMLNLNLQAARYLNDVRMVPDADDPVIDDFEDIAAALSIYNSTRQQIDRQTPRRSV